ncbi:DUF4224 domain-containing protein [Caldimonas brevitalea]|uniref:DUF4224 domain-containing protein n=1 Tax=Caldimonas brevitalea TaxID=413882 RepID=A0A0G3BL79_9BURK|nr:DUF4224 domain-containing protein [Caldimonas brevitalea]AKJ28748.1 hypothetical protein AAW51_2057 [Caldimonas brevitalea]
MRSTLPHPDLDLTDEEIDRICAGLTQNAAKVRYLRSLGLHVERKPNGRPLVNRAHYNEVRGGMRDFPMAEVGAGPVWGVH